MQEREHARNRSPVALFGRTIFPLLRKTDCVLRVFFVSSEAREELLKHLKANTYAYASVSYWKLSGTFFHTEWRLLSSIAIRKICIINLLFHTRLQRDRLAVHES